jgi:predicted transcriptional regulator
MKVHFCLELEKKLNDLATASGRSVEELVQDAVAGWVDELDDRRSMLDRRYDDIQSGRVKLIPGAEAFARLRERIDARRSKLA